MPPKIRLALVRLGSTARGFSAAQRTIAIIGIAVLALGAFGLVSWLAKPAYTPLFSGLSGEDASSIVDQLRTDNVPYELSNGGATIMVPEANVYDERLKAASNGLPSASTGGYSLLDKMGVTTSEFQQSVTYKRAIEGELAKTLGAMTGVKAASVQLAIPQQSVFVSEAKDPTASVFIQTDAGVTLTTSQVNAIVHLTSASIEGMKATDVSVVDAAGNVLSAVGTGTSGSSDSQASTYENRVHDTVQAMLDRVLGPGNSTVAVAADVSNATSHVTTETFTNAENVPAINESTQSETYNGGGSGSSQTGVLGPDNIAVPSGTSTGAAGSGAYVKTDSTKNNAVNKVTEKKDVPAGQISQQSVSVAVDSKAAKGMSASAITDMVNAAAGIQPTRGDTVAVKILPFSSSASKQASAAIASAESAQAADNISSIIRTAIIALAILVPIMLLIVLFVRRSRQEREEVELDVLPFMEATPSGPTPPPAPVSRPDVNEIGATPSDMDVRRAEISQFAAADPQKTAEFLRGLMDESRV